jgi:hypothetical protein
VFGVPGAWKVKVGRDWFYFDKKFKDKPGSEYDVGLHLELQEVAHRGVGAWAAGPFAGFRIEVFMGDYVNTASWAFCGLQN